MHWAAEQLFLLNDMGVMAGVAVIGQDSHSCWLGCKACHW
jgi:hypothetical protein